MLVNERKVMADAIRDMSYRLGAAETRVQQLEAPRERLQSPHTGDDMPRRGATEPADAAAIVVEAREPQPKEYPCHR
jgi:hypothetical protein